MDHSALYERVRRSFYQQSFLALIGATLESVQPGNVVVACQARDDLLQQQGLLHAGVVTTLADVACGYAALTCMPEESDVLSVELKINLLRPALAPKIVAAGQVLKAGKTLVVTEAAVTDEHGTLLAKVISTMMRVPKKHAESSVRTG